MLSKARLKFLKKMIILGPKTAILGPQFCRILVLGPHFWWSGGSGPLGPPWIHPWIISLHTLVLAKEFCYIQSFDPEQRDKKTERQTPGQYKKLFKYGWPAIK